VLDNLAGVAAGGRNDALNRAAWTLGRWIAAGALEQRAVEGELYAAAEHNGLVADDGERADLGDDSQRPGAGLQEPLDLDAR
jgi:hypothetical protein